MSSAKGEMGTWKMTSETMLGNTEIFITMVPIFMYKASTKISCTITALAHVHLCVSNPGQCLYYNSVSL